MKIMKNFRNYRIIKDRIASEIMVIFTISSLLLVVAMAIGLYLKSTDILAEHSFWELLTASEWRPMQNQFGFLAFLIGTFYVTGVAIIIALPSTSLQVCRRLSSVYGALLLSYLSLAIGLVLPSEHRHRAIRCFLAQLY